MKKPVLTALGVASACLACCAIPLAIPLLGGTVALGLTSWLAVNVPISLDLLLLLVMVSMAALWWGTKAWARRKRASACASETASGSACSVSPGTTGCGCSPR